MQTAMQKSKLLEVISSHRSLSSIPEEQELHEHHSYFWDEVGNISNTYSQSRVLWMANDSHDNGLWAY